MLLDELRVCMQGLKTSFVDPRITTGELKGSWDWQ